MTRNIMTSYIVTRKIVTRNIITGNVVTKNNITRYIGSSYIIITLCIPWMTCLRCITWCRRCAGGCNDNPFEQSPNG